MYKARWISIYSDAGLGAASGRASHPESVLPNAATAVIGLDRDWADLAAGTGELVATWSPKAED